MAKIDDKQVGVARVYTQSLLELAQEQNAVDEIRDELRELAKIIEGDADFERFLTSPLVEVEERRAALEKVFRGKASDLLVDTLQVLNQRERLALVPAIAQLFHLEYEELKGRVEVHVKSAVPLSEKLRDQLRATLKKRTGREPDLVEEVDSALIGGIVIRVGDEKYDGSVRHHIAELEEIFHHRARQEIYRTRREAQEAAG